MKISLLIKYALIWFGLSFIFSPQIFAQNNYTVFDRYDFDIEAGHFDEIEVGAKTKLLNSGYIKGKISLTSCNKHDEWDSGIRFVFEDATAYNSIFMGLTCRRNSSDLQVEWMKAEGQNEDWEMVGGNQTTIDRDLGEEISFKIEFRKTAAIINMNNIKYEVPLDYIVEDIKLTPFGVTGYVLIEPPVS